MISQVQRDLTDYLETTLAHARVVFLLVRRADVTHCYANSDFDSMGRAVVAGDDYALCCFARDQIAPRYAGGIFNT